MNLLKLKEYGPSIVRITLALVFLWFGITQLIDPSIWTGYIPKLITGLGVSARSMVIANGIFEIVFGALLLFGKFIRFSAFVLGFHLIGISFSIGYGAIFVRDLGLAIATLSIVLTGPDKLCIPEVMRKM